MSTRPLGFGAAAAAAVPRCWLVTADGCLAATVRALWSGEGDAAGQRPAPARPMDWRVFDNGRAVLEQFFLDPPDLLLVSAALPDMSGVSLIQLVKGENVYRQVATVLAMDVPGVAGMDWQGVEADDFMVLPATPAPAEGTGCMPLPPPLATELSARIELALTRAGRALDASPLTRLPGNTSIIKFIQGLIDRRMDFALAYADLDNFKAFNDKYGFSRGDEVLMLTARLLATTVREVRGQPAFVGHVGGDDFVFVTPVDEAEDACRRVVGSFDAIVPGFYDADDRTRGAIVAHDRQGQVRSFPLMAVSIAVVCNQPSTGLSLAHYGEASYRASQVKKLAKDRTGSCYVFDRRQA
ncbi:GGDEF domain-containing response regulator [Nitratidesulfovibrio termitidis]|uniref:GGDEF domain-containing response regulator n=1 Tax=Nitratidesulfovibrio termitidis TaxID=42252 RepID=UPI00042056AC|nr:diguanylate cyclase [Nitratidesulfovibrio termitidis]